MSRNLEKDEIIEHIEGMAQERILEDFLDSEEMTLDEVVELSKEELDEFVRNYKMFINSYGI